MTTSGMAQEFARSLDDKVQPHFFDTSLPEEFATFRRDILHHVSVNRQVFQTLPLHIEHSLRSYIPVEVVNLRYQRGNQKS
jgi:hypothetical protein